MFSYHQLVAKHLIPLTLPLHRLFVCPSNWNQLDFHHQNQHQDQHVMRKLLYRLHSICFVVGARDCGCDGVGPGMNRCVSVESGGSQRRQQQHFVASLHTHPMLPRPPPCHSHQQKITPKLPFSAGINSWQVGSFFMNRRSFWIKTPSMLQHVYMMITLTKQEVPSVLHIFTRIDIGGADISKL